MYSYRWDKKTGGYILAPQAGKFVASEIRPVFAQELKLIGFDKHFKFDEQERAPICWAKRNIYIYRGVEIAKLEKTQYGKPITPNYLVSARRLKPVDVEAMIAHPENQRLMSALLADTQRRLKEMYDQYAGECDIAYIGFSGGKDSVLLLDICHRTLPLSVPVVFSDTDMELPDTYKIWKEVQRRYPDRTFLKAQATQSALKNWDVFGPPSRTIRWCCSVHKSTPAILLLREYFGQNKLHALAFLGIRSEESISRATYDDIGVGVKNASQINSYPVLAWGSHELWLYTFATVLPINSAYKQGLPRVGCVLCPEASERYAWFVNAVYPNVLKPYNDAIFNAIDKEFDSEKDKLDYLSTAGWQARKSGEILKNQILRPSEEISAETMSWLIPSQMINRVQEWFKTLGLVRVDADGAWEILYKSRSSKLQTDLLVEFKKSTKEVCHVSCKFRTTAELRSYGKYVRQCIYKAVSCVGCRACEVECSLQALKFKDGFASIDVDKCIHCLNCHSADYGCWRYQSMRTTEVSNAELATINKYKNFGLRQNWVDVYISEREKFAMTMALGNKMIESGKVWLRQGLLMNEKNCTPLRLLDLAESRGSGSQWFWDAIWFALSNRAAIMKWFVTVTKVNQVYSPDDLFSLMGGNVKEATKKGGISALKDMLTKSPFGTGMYPMVELVMKGRLMSTLTRVPHAVDDLVLLYSLFVMAQQAGQTSFSVSGLMTADFSAKYVSPLVAFAMPVAEFKQQCQGLSDKYGDFIRCNFTLGLDEIQIRIDAKTSDDVVELMINA